MLRQSSPTRTSLLCRPEREDSERGGTGVETDKLIVLGGSGGQHDDERVRLLPEYSANLESVDSGNHQIQHNKVRQKLPGQLERVVAPGGREDRVAVVLQIEPDEAQCLLIVIDDENSRMSRILLHIFFTPPSDNVASNCHGGTYDT
jgi:hypothetical protein